MDIMVYNTTDSYSLPALSPPNTGIVPVFKYFHFVNLRYVGGPGILKTKPRLVAPFYDSYIYPWFYLVLSKRLDVRSDSSTLQTYMNHPSPLDSVIANRKGSWGPGRLSQ